MILIRLVHGGAHIKEIARIMYYIELSRTVTKMDELILQLLLISNEQTDK